MTGAWEIIDTRHPARPGPRYADLARAAEVVRQASPAGRFVLRWVTDKQATTNEDGAT